MIKMTEKLKERISHILSALDKEYGTDFICYLNYETPWQLLIAVILSAQCTDARVNIVTADLFKKYPTLEAFAQADLKELEQDIHSIGFYHMKAKNINSMFQTAGWKNIMVLCQTSWKICLHWLVWAVRQPM